MSDPCLPAGFYDPARYDDVRTLEAPRFMTRRESARAMFAELPEGLMADITVEFAAESFPTTSFIDELVLVTLVEGRARQLHLSNVDAFTAELVAEAADRYGVAAPTMGERS